MTSRSIIETFAPAMIVFSEGARTIGTIYRTSRGMPLGLRFIAEEEHESTRIHTNLRESKEVSLVTGHLSLAGSSWT